MTLAQRLLASCSLLVASLPIAASAQTPHNEGSPPTQPVIAPATTATSAPTPIAAPPPVAAPAPIAAPAQQAPSAPPQTLPAPPPPPPAMIPPLPPPPGDLPFFGIAQLDRPMAHGITFGGSLAMHLGRVIPNDAVSQDSITASFMPYVLISPAYWGSNIGQLCAAHGSVSEPVMARLRKHYQIDSVGSECIWHKIGIYVGKPFSYDTKTTVGRDTAPTAREREVRTLLSTGLAFSPAAYYSITLGLTFAAVNRDDHTSTSLVIPTVGIGANADMLKLLF